MADSVKKSSTNTDGPQCQYFVVRKKRLCRMTVRPGRQYCGEHEPDPKTEDGQDDTRIPCPNDPNHTCYISKLEKHLSICNARPTEQPPYIVYNINAPAAIEACPRKPLSEISKETLLQVIDKVNYLYDKHVKDNISTAQEQPIHSTVLQEFSECDRTESSLRHLRQASRLLWLVEETGLVQDRTCYVELGAGKGQLSYYSCNAWCEQAGGSSALAVDRACVRHKRDNRVRERGARRLRADLAHLALQRAPGVQPAGAVVGLAKHLCGVATDYALRCMTAAGVVHKTRGVVLATCCHHRCAHGPYVATKHLQELGISGEELNVMLGVVSWATCGDGRSRQRREQDHAAQQAEDLQNDLDSSKDEQNDLDSSKDDQSDLDSSKDDQSDLDSSKDDQSDLDSSNQVNGGSGQEGINATSEKTQARLILSQEYRECVGRKAKALLDWGRVLYLREAGFDARLLYYVPTSVSLENVCIVAKKL